MWGGALVRINVKQSYLIINHRLLIIVIFVTLWPQGNKVMHSNYMLLITSFICLLTLCRVSWISALVNYYGEDGSSNDNNNNNNKN
jgi:hypothetical protein